MLRSIMVLSSLLLCSVVHADFDVFQISQSGSGFDPAVSGNIIVWEGGGFGNPLGIYGCDVTNGEEFLIYESAGQSYTSWDPDLDGNFVVWREIGTQTDQILGYDLSSGNCFLVADTISSASEPKISGNLVIWSDTSGPNSGLFGKNINSGEAYTLTTSSKYDIEGTNVMYEELGLSPVGEPPLQQAGIYIENILSGESTRISNYTELTGVYSLTLDHDKAMWIQNDDIYVYDLLDSTLVEIIDTNLDSPFYADISGDIVIWTKNYNVYGYNLASDALFTIYESTEDLYSPRIDGNLVVWESGSIIYGTYIPEPATISMLVLGGILLKRKRLK